MFKCEICGTVVPANTSAVRVVLEERSKTYPKRVDAHPRQEHVKKSKKKYNDDPGGRGTEIVREALACPACASANLS